VRSIVTVTSAASSTLLTTLSRVKTDLGISGGQDDAALTNAIAGASSRITAYLGQTLAFEGVTETFRPDRGYECSERLFLDRSPVVTMTSVTVDNDAALASSKYEVDKSAGILYRLDDSGHPLRWEFNKSIVVVYTGGYFLPDDSDANLPAAIEEATVALVRSLWFSRRRDPMVKSVEVPDLISESYWVGAIGERASLPNDVLMLLDQCRRLRL
jgi:hypothetical protein